MKVLHISDNALSGAPFRLVQVQRLGGVEARLINRFHAFDRRVYPRDLLMDDDPEVLTRLIEEADLVHFHNNWLDTTHLFHALPRARDLLRRKPCLVQFHSPRFPQFETALRAPGLTRLVVAQYQVRLYPECLPVPNAVPIDDPLHRPLDLENDPPVVAFTPPQCEDTETWGRKGCQETLGVLRQGFRHWWASEVPWEETMRGRQRCDIAIDEVVTGSYHMCSLESLSQGLATVAGLDARTVDALEIVTGTRQHPWIVATPATLRSELTRLVEDAAYRRAMRQAARRYMERFWSPEVVTRKFLDIYHGILEG